MMLLKERRRRDFYDLPKPALTLIGLLHDAVSSAMRAARATSMVEVRGTRRPANVVP
jgi:hypothetical protein